MTGDAPVRLTLSHAEYQQFREVQMQRRWDWPATFSANHHGEVWPYVTSGFTPEVDRRNIQGDVPLIDELVSYYLLARSEGGRFFINETGAYFKTSGLHQFVRFAFTDGPVNRTRPRRPG